MSRTFQIIAAVPGIKSQVRIDGNLLDCVRGFTLSADVDTVPRLELDLLMFEDTPLSGEAEVIVPQSTHDALVALGWTPPTEGGASWPS